MNRQSCAACWTRRCTSTTWNKCSTRCPLPVSWVAHSTLRECAVLRVPARARHRSCLSWLRHVALTHKSRLLFRCSCGACQASSTSLWLAPGTSPVSSSYVTRCSSRSFWRWRLAGLCWSICLRVLAPASLSCPQLSAWLASTLGAALVVVLCLLVWCACCLLWLLVAACGCLWLMGGTTGQDGDEADAAAPPGSSEAYGRHHACR